MLDYENVEKLKILLQSVDKVIPAGENKIENQLTGGYHSSEIRERQHNVKIHFRSYYIRYPGLGRNELYG